MTDRSKVRIILHLVEAREIEPLSESLFTRPSPGASVYLNSLSVPGNGTLHGQVAS